MRIELFDDVVENLSWFDPLTGEVLRKVPRITVYPKSHYVTPKEKLMEAVEKIKIELDERLEYLKSENRLVELQRLEQRTNYDLEMIRELGYCSGIETYSRYLSNRKVGEAPPTLFDYLPDNALVVVDESHVTIPQIGAMYKGDRSRKENLVNFGFRLPSALDNRPMRFDEWEKIIPQMIFVSATPSKYEAANADQIVEQVVRPTGLLDPIIEIRPATNQVDDLLGEINKMAAQELRTVVTVLTKRMAEDLTDYLADHGVRVRYLHSDIDTVERVEIIRDLRLGEFDALVGINLLREGIDMPEVGLVTILDADKEGFLRSETSMIQTIGRAARNINGRAILYADRITGSMQRAMDETQRRREKQIEYNKANGITPKGIIKSVADIMEGASTIPGRKAAKHIKRISGISDDPQTDAKVMTPKELSKALSSLENSMYQAAKNLEFELAGHYRDQLETIKHSALQS